MLLITRLLIELFLKGGGTRGVTDAFHRVGQSLQNSSVQTVLAPARLPTAPLPTAPLPTAPLPTAPLPTAPLPTAPLPTAPLPTAPLPVTRSANPSLRGGNGQLRLHRHIKAWVQKWCESHLVMCQSHI